MLEIFKNKTLRKFPLYGTLSQVVELDLSLTLYNYFCMILLNALLRIQHHLPQKAIKAAKNTVAPLSNKNRARAALQVSRRYQKSHLSSHNGHMKKSSRGVLQMSSLQMCKIINQ